ncbi:MAG TPA: type II toxin-antitoxin system PemK/MazF family toxin [Rhizomicrobium sp.]|nr:type II toxin-antitoxin system PemK/MazF family toxin [Rhizomicrobium sp.]
MIKWGEIYFVSLDPAKGREQAGKRPVLVVSSDIINAQPLVVTVAAGTDSKNLSRNYPTNIRVTAAESGLPKDTVFLCFQVRSLHHTRFREPIARRVGALPLERMAEVEDALRRVVVL